MAVAVVAIAPCSHIGRWMAAVTWWRRAGGGCGGGGAGGGYGGEEMAATAARSAGPACQDLAAHETSGSGLIDLPPQRRRPDRRCTSDPSHQGGSGGTATVADGDGGGCGDGGWRRWRLWR